eukprot:TRINITY_DN1873_c0_g1_i2.p1 TRINITY_DN1873_c0_g1~~TRINITY_DN1873_c0_g1_i2.p1  ORF type:complete len:281 (+),score=57.11 TRINITY_DN1873_c0_g1_i2:128-970(+)
MHALGGAGGEDGPAPAAVDGRGSNVAGMLGTDLQDELLKLQAQSDAAAAVGSWGAVEQLQKHINALRGSAPDLDHMPTAGAASHGGVLAGGDDESKDLVKAMMDGLKPLTALPANKDGFKAALADVEGLRIPVPANRLNLLRQKINSEQYPMLKAVPGSHHAAYKFADLIEGAPEDFGSELTTTVAVTNMITGVFSLIKSSVMPRLNYHINLNTTEHVAGSKSAGVSAQPSSGSSSSRSRPTPPRSTKSTVSPTSGPSASTPSSVQPDSQVLFAAPELNF